MNNDWIQVLDLRKLPTTALSDFHDITEGCETLSRKYLRTMVEQVKTEVIIFHEPLVEHEEQMTVGPNSRRAELERFLQLELVLSQDMDPRQIEVLELELVLRGEWLDGYTPTCTHPLSRRLFSHLSRFTNVKIFNIVCPVSLSIPENLLVETLRNMNVLSSLAADNISYREEGRAPGEAELGTDDDEEQRHHHQLKRAPRSRLAECLAELKSLRSLRMYDSLCVDDVWSEIQWQTPIAEMELVRCVNLSSLAMQRFTRQFEERLGRMTMCTMGQSEREQIESESMMSTSESSVYLWELLQRENRPFFQNLRSLKLVGINMCEHLLKSFQHSPRLVTLHVDSPIIRAKALLSFIRHAKRLRALNCRVRGGPGSLDVIMYCLSHAILLDESFY